ncbi:dTDP-4-dehydrorhamnose reductase [Parablautia sp. Marseille-Q6255]|uniref:dTDP-4-dehydrorhamnose reductase n=1 Tax=Parablautia sp. Marseille-Q6255 TaxID=3039593 RepID=UPI0024BC1354|nr:dTDP-4-dehydrorhamnose reductase [Parablautia sp. Marseille-Q6255]
MRVLVTGVSGQLGHDVMNELAKRGHLGIGSATAPLYSGIADGTAVTQMPYIAMDITDSASAERTFQKVLPDAVIHCSAWTAVDLAEDKLKKVQDINATGTKYIAKMCKKLNCKMLYISTDYIFDGQGTIPWDPDCKNYSPLNVYGQTKLEGELAVSSLLQKYFIIRISWVFGKNGKNYIKTMLNLGKNHDTLRIVNDQIGTPTYTFDLARLLVDMAETEKYGYYHATNSELSDKEGAYTPEGCKTGYISWFDFTKEIFRQVTALGYEKYAPQNTKLIPVTTAEYGISKAARPFNSRLDKRKLTENGFTPLPDWPDAIHRYLKEIEI